MAGSHNYRSLRTNHNIIILIVVAAFAILGCVIIAENTYSTDAHTDYFTSDGIEYHVEGENSVSVYDSDKIDVVIPSSVSYNGVTYSVDTIDNSSFSANKVVRTISIPNSVTSISDNSFAYCSSLSEITVSSDNPNYCSVDGILFNKAGDELIKYPIAKEDKIYTISSKINKICDNAFCYCEYLETVKIENSSLTIDGNSFYICPRLNEYTVSDDNTSYSSENGVLFNKSKDKLLAYPTGRSDLIYTIPESVTAIGDHAFYSCLYLTSVIIPEKTASIGKYAFAYSSVTSIDIPGNVKSIDDYAFFQCRALSSVTLGKGVESIGAYAFCGCSSIRAIAIPETVTKIGVDALNACPKLTGIEVDANNKNYASVQGVLVDKDMKHLIRYPAAKSDTEYSILDTIEEVDASAFMNCDNIRTVVIPDSVKKIGLGAFWYCSSLENLKIGAGLSEMVLNSILFDCDSMKSIEVSENNSTYCSENGVLFNKSKTILYFYPAQKADTDYVVPDTVQSIYSSFKDCIFLKNIKLPDSLGGSLTFSDCSSLESLTIPDGVYYISIFNCSSLETVKIGKGLDTNDCFDDCPSLKEITVDAENQYLCSADGVLFNKDMTKLIQYPANKDSSSYTVPSTVKNIQSYAFSDCKKIEKLTLGKDTSISVNSFSECNSLKEVIVSDDNPIYKSLDGILFDKTATELIYYPAGRTDRSYSIPEGVKFVHNSAFDGSNIETVILPKSFEGGIFGFASQSLKEIIVSEDNANYSSENGALLSKDKKTLYFCPRGITEFTVPDSVENIGVIYCDKMEKLVLSENVKTVDMWSILVSGSLELEIRNDSTLFTFGSIMAVKDMKLTIVSSEDFVLPTCAAYSITGDEFEVEQTYFAPSSGNSSSNVVLYVIIAVAAVALVCIIIIVAVKRSKNKQYAAMTKDRMDYETEPAVDTEEPSDYDTPTEDNMPKEEQISVEAAGPIIEGCTVPTQSEEIRKKKAVPQPDSNKCAESSQFEEDLNRRSEELISTTLLDIATYLTDGVNLSEDIVEGLSEKGTFAQTAIGLMYLYGFGGLGQSDEEAFRYLGYAAADGKYYVPMAIACLYATGRGTEKDAGKALYWFTIAERRSNGEFKLDSDPVLSNTSP